jgi:hypothetical protein
LIFALMGGLSAFSLSVFFDKAFSDVGKYFFGRFSFALFPVKVFFPLPICRRGASRQSYIAGGQFFPFMDGNGFIILEFFSCLKASIPDLVDVSISTVHRILRI